MAFFYFDLHHEIHSITGVVRSIFPFYYAMSNRNLMHYFSSNVTVKSTDELTTSLVADEQETKVETAVQSSALAKRPRTAKIRPIVVDDDDDYFENDLLLPPQHGITKYFSPVDRQQAVTRKHKKPCVMTVKVQVHGSPQKKGCKAPAAAKKGTKKKKRKIGIPSALADAIELVSSEEMVTESSPEVMVVIKPAEPVQPPTPKTRWKMKISLSSKVKVSDGNDHKFSMFYVYI